MGSEGSIHRGKCRRHHDIGFMLYGWVGFGGLQIFGAVLIWPFSVLMESGRNFWTASAVRPGQVAKKLLLVDFVREEQVGLNANRCRKFNSSVFFFAHTQSLPCAHKMDSK